MKNYNKPQLNIESTLISKENIAQSGLGEWLEVHGLESATSYNITTFITEFVQRRVSGQRF